MAGKRVLTARLVVDMIASEDVHTSDGQLLFTEGTILTEDIIAALKEHSVFAIRIKVGEDGVTPLIGEHVSEEGRIEIIEKPAENLEVDFAPKEPRLEMDVSEKSHYDAVRETKEYQEFTESFTKTVDHMKESFSRAVMKNEEIDSEAILENVQDVVSKSRNSLHILDMLQCMKGYDDVTYVHSMNVALLSNVIGRLVMPKMSEEDLEALTLAGLLCDIGKMMIPDDILQKKERLTLPEMNVVKTHVLHGNNILQGMKLDPRIAEAAMRHHERCDGSGYPGGYRMDQISQFARIIAVADTYDAMTSDRPYRKAICPFEVIRMFEGDGRFKYDAEFFWPFLSTVVQSLLNTKVCLSTGETGTVVMMNTEELSKPLVRVGDTYHDLARERSITIDRMAD
ncbi:HD-GYP domain-containing protein [bacterium D16-51]|nr:HD-GYP domain-containing protein [bacterium D16-59]RKI60932.1 HD-GYP domain-containing protein [bacterium D16-51]